MQRILAENISFGYDKETQVFENVSLDVSCDDGYGIVIAVMGESGAGKTTLLKLLLGLEKPKSGSISMGDGVSQISYVPQEPVLFEHLSPWESAAYFKRTVRYRHLFDKELFNRIAEKLGLTEILQSNAKITNLSGGQKQRISLLRALSIRPRILLLDEPCNGLDQEVKLSFLTELRELAESLGIIVLYITHHFDEARLIADRICYLVKDELHNKVIKLTNQSFDEFHQAPPSKGALVLAGFPIANILKVMESKDAYTLTSEPDGYIHVGTNNFKVEPSEGARFNLMSRSGCYSVYKHIHSDNILVFDNSVVREDSFTLQLKDKVNFYNKTGVYTGVKEIKKLR